MLATLVIGLREGLEAALIVGMIAAFLRRNGASLKPVWLGVGAAVLLSALVGVTLEIASAALPQQQQEAVESIIGAVAVAIVTYMVAWMGRNSRSMKSTLEEHAGSALKGGSVMALAGMAFLAVLREGVETAVFMVAAFQSSLNPLAAGFGAVLGLAIASCAGFLLFRGAIKLNLAKFFKVTGVFLVFVAAGLVMKSLRTAHEAGWLNAGQDATVNLAWLAPNGSARAAILTGVFGIPSDPRVVELLGWALYLVPMLAFILWPRCWRPAAAALPRAQFTAAAALGTVAAALVVAAPLAIPPAPPSNGTTPAVSSSGAPAVSLRVVHGARASGDNGPTLVEAAAGGSETIHALTGHGTESHAGRTVSVYTAAAPAAGPSAGEAATLSTTDLAGLNGGRMPVGISPAKNPGPFAASWTHKGEITVWLANGTLIDAVRTQWTALTLSGGGLATPRTIAVAADNGWHVPEDQVGSAVGRLGSIEAATADNVLWFRYLPAAIALAALVLAGAAIRTRGRLRAATTPRNALERQGSSAPL